MKLTARHTVPGLFLAVALSCCSAGKDTPPEPETVGFTIEIGSGPGGGSFVTMGGVRMLVGSDVRLVYPATRHRLSISSPEGESVATSREVREVQVNGHTLSVKDGVLHLSDTGYGPVSGATAVEIRSGGVHVDGEIRGSLPD